jgi:hypothetical protein
MEDIKDPKYLGIPNICFSLTSKDDKREEYLSKQRIERGFDDSETWSLRDTIANFIVPRLERFKELGYDFVDYDEEFKKDLESFLTAMKLASRNKGIMIFTKEEEVEYQKGLEAFPRIFSGLWW